MKCQFQISDLQIKDVLGNIIHQLTINNQQLFFRFCKRNLLCGGCYYRFAGNEKECGVGIIHFLRQAQDDMLLVIGSLVIRHWLGMGVNGL